MISVADNSSNIIFDIKQFLCFDTNHLDSRPSIGTTLSDKLLKEIN